ncbi:putative Dedicator of cytokinesis protein 7 [Blattamonas nauphoetae]|uniref:Dedicator of cytokinesis protein 7 n=1 Tax=Blattamonas nauphoetae TaxID=2049346 RepID=A0ABQ9XGB7_9EUKA|nr:putative Dedicator of cytokinesis protein 7 [Blattamonas nauphoetae]
MDYATINNHPKRTKNTSSPFYVPHLIDSEEAGTKEENQLLKDAVANSQAKCSQLTQPYLIGYEPPKAMNDPSYRLSTSCFPNPPDSIRHLSIPPIYPFDMYRRQAIISIKPTSFSFPGAPDLHEPFFFTLSLFDLGKKTKLTEEFVFSLNKPDHMELMKDIKSPTVVTGTQRMADVALFSINPDNVSQVVLVLRVLKTLTPTEGGGYKKYAMTQKDIEAIKKKYDKMESYRKKIQERVRLYGDIQQQFGFWESELCIKSDPVDDEDEIKPKKSSQDGNGLVFTFLDSPTLKAKERSFEFDRVYEIEANSLHHLGSDFTEGDIMTKIEQIHKKIERNEGGNSAAQPEETTQGPNGPEAESEEAILSQRSDIPFSMRFELVVLKDSPIPTATLPDNRTLPSWEDSFRTNKDSENPSLNSTINLKRPQTMSPLKSTPPSIPNRPAPIPPSGPPTPLNRSLVQSTVISQTSSPTLNRQLFPPNQNIRHVLSFPSPHNPTPFLEQTSLLYIYPESVQFSMLPSSASIRNIYVEIRVKQTDSSVDEAGLPLIFNTKCDGRADHGGMLEVINCAMKYHSHPPSFGDEIKIALPLNCQDKLHVLFSFYHVQCKQGKKGERPPKISLAYSVLPLDIHNWKKNDDGSDNEKSDLSPSLEIDTHALPIFTSLPAGYMSWFTPSGKESTVKAPEQPVLQKNQLAFSLRHRFVSTVQTQSHHLQRFFALTGIPLPISPLSSSTLIHIKSLQDVIDYEQINQPTEQQQMYWEKALCFLKLANERFVLGHVTPIFNQLLVGICSSSELIRNASFRSFLDVAQLTDRNSPQSLSLLAQAKKHGIKLTSQTELSPILQNYATELMENPMSHVGTRMYPFISFLSTWRNHLHVMRLSPSFNPQLASNCTDEIESQMHSVLFDSATIFLSKFRLTTDHLLFSWFIFKCILRSIQLYIFKTHVSPIASMAGLSFFTPSSASVLPPVFFDALDAFVEESVLFIKLILKFTETGMERQVLCFVKSFICFITDLTIVLGTGRKEREREREKLEATLRNKSVPGPSQTSAKQDDVYDISTSDLYISPFEQNRLVHSLMTFFNEMNPDAPQSIRSYWVIKLSALQILTQSDAWYLLIFPPEVNSAAPYTLQRKRPRRKKRLMKEQREKQTPQIGRGLYSQRLANRLSVAESDSLDASFWAEEEEREEVENQNFSWKPAGSRYLVHYVIMQIWECQTLLNGYCRLPVRKNVTTEKMEDDGDNDEPPSPLNSTQEEAKSFTIQRKFIQTTLEMCPIKKEYKSWITDFKPFHLMRDLLSRVDIDELFSPNEQTFTQTRTRQRIAEMYFLFAVITFENIPTLQAMQTTDSYSVTECLLCCLWILRNSDPLLLTEWLTDRNASVDYSSNRSKQDTDLRSPESFESIIRFVSFALPVLQSKNFLHLMTSEEFSAPLTTGCEDMFGEQQLFVPHMQQTSNKKKKKDDKKEKTQFQTLDRQTLLTNWQGKDLINRCRFLTCICEDTLLRILHDAVVNVVTLTQPPSTFEQQARLPVGEQQSEDLLTQRTSLQLFYPHVRMSQTDKNPFDVSKKTPEPDGSIPVFHRLFHPDEGNMLHCLRLVNQGVDGLSEEWRPTGLHLVENVKGLAAFIWDAVIDLIDEICCTENIFLFFSLLNFLILHTSYFLFLGPTQHNHLIVKKLLLMGCSTKSILVRNNAIQSLYLLMKFNTIVQQDQQNRLRAAAAQPDSFIHSGSAQPSYDQSQPNAPPPLPPPPALTGMSATKAPATPAPTQPGFPKPRLVPAPPRPGTGPVGSIGLAKGRYSLAISNQNSVTLPSLFSRTKTELIRIVSSLDSLTGKQEEELNIMLTLIQGIVEDDNRAAQERMKQEANRPRDGADKSQTNVWTIEQQDLILFGRQSQFDAVVNDLCYQVTTIIMNLSRLRKMKDEQWIQKSQLYWTIVKSYGTNPVLRFVWLGNLVEAQLKQQKVDEAAITQLMKCGLILEIICEFVERRYIPSPPIKWEWADYNSPTTGCSWQRNIRKIIPDYQKMSKETLNKLLSNEVIESIINSNAFTFTSVIEQLSYCAALFNHAKLFELTLHVRFILQPLYFSSFNIKPLPEFFTSLASDCQGIVDNTAESRIRYSFYLIGLYGNIFGELNGREFVWKEYLFVSLGDMVKIVKNEFSNLIDPDEIIFLKDHFPAAPTYSKGFSKRSRSATNTPTTEVYHLPTPKILDPTKCYVNIKPLEIDSLEGPSELSANPSLQSLRISRFHYDQNFTREGVKQASMENTYLYRRIVTTEHSIPYCLTLVRVDDSQTEVIEFSPCQNAMIDIHNRIAKIQQALEAEPFIIKSLQYLLAGALTPQVNQGPIAIFHLFLRDKQAEISKEDANLVKTTFFHFFALCYRCLEKHAQFPTQVEMHNSFVEGYNKYLKDIEDEIPGLPMASLL